jgi:DNA-binding PadR family transcriptional regulator
VSSTSDTWNDLNNAVLAVFKDTPLTAGDVRRVLRDVPDSYIRAALNQNTEHGFLSAHRGAVHTTYTITEAGRRHLTNTLEVA